MISDRHIQICRFTRCSNSQFKGSKPVRGATEWPAIHETSKEVTSNYVGHLQYTINGYLRTRKESVEVLRECAIQESEFQIQALETI